MSHPLIDRLLDECGYTQVDADNHVEFTGQPGMNVLFFPGDPLTVRDATDVAVILPELVKVFDGRLHAGVVIDTFGAGKELKRHYGFSAYPSLVFVREGEYVGTITRVQDWSEYLRQVGDLLVAPARRLPGVGIPVVAEQSTKH